MADAVEVDEAYLLAGESHRDPFSLQVIVRETSLAAERAGDRIATLILDDLAFDAMNVEAELPQTLYMVSQTKGHSRYRQFPNESDEDGKGLHLRTLSACRVCVSSSSKAC